MSERPTLRAALILLGTFVLGLVCGAALLRIGQHTVLTDRPGALPGGGPPGIVGPPLEHLDRRLDLDPEQRRAIREIVRRQRERFRELLEESRLEIREVLTPEQREVFDRMGPGPRRRPGDGMRRGGGRPAPPPE